MYLWHSTIIGWGRSCTQGDSFNTSKIIKILTGHFQVTIRWWTSAGVLLSIPPVKCLPVDPTEMKSKPLMVPPVLLEPSDLPVSSPSTPDQLHSNLNDHFFVPWSQQLQAHWQVLLHEIFFSYIFLQGRHSYHQRHFHAEAFTDYPPCSNLQLLVH